MSATPPAPVVQRRLTRRIAWRWIAIALWGVAFVAGTARTEPSSWLLMLSPLFCLWFGVSGLRRLSRSEAPPAHLGLGRRWQRPPSRNSFVIAVGTVLSSYALFLGLWALAGLRASPLFFFLLSGMSLIFYHLLDQGWWEWRAAQGRVTPEECVPVEPTVAQTRPQPASTWWTSDATRDEVRQANRR